jgi:hypothetical protein
MVVAAGAGGAPPPRVHHVAHRGIPQPGLQGDLTDGSGMATLLAVTLISIPEVVLWSFRRVAHWTSRRPNVGAAWRTSGWMGQPDPGCGPDGAGHRRPPPV